MDEKCAVCSQYFNQNNLAWIISFCGHNICTHCLKHAKVTKLKHITCKQCKKKYNVDSQTLQQFPKNITILKLIKQSKNGSSIISQSNSKKIEDSSLLLSDSFPRNNSSTCEKHGKPLQIICTVDRQYICSSCALFGQHKNHNSNNSFRTLQQFQSDLCLLKQKYRQIQFKRQLSQQNIRGKKYRSSIISKISIKKDKLVVEIKQKFQQLIGMIKDAESKVFEELIKSFRIVDSQISKVTKEEQPTEKQYNRWKKQIASYLKQIDDASDIKSKINVFYRQNRPGISQGQSYLNQIQAANNQIRGAVQDKINSLKIQYSGSMEGVIYNYANVSVNPCEIKVKSIKDIKPYVYAQAQQPKGFKKEMRIQFVKNQSIEGIKSDRQIPKTEQNYSNRINDFAKTHRAPLLHKVKSNQKIPKIVMQEGKKSHTPPKFIQNIKTLAEQKRSQNLQFAERMLNQFLKSTDTLDITGCQLNDQQILHIISTASAQKQIKCIKLCRNKLTNNGLSRIVQHLPSVTNINLSYNLLTDDSIDVFIDRRQLLLSLRIINLSHNKLNERKVKTKLQQLRKVGIITTL